MAIKSLLYPETQHAPAARKSNAEVMTLAKNWKSGPIPVEVKDRMFAILRDEECPKSVIYYALTQDAYRGFALRNSLRSDATVRAVYYLIKNGSSMDIVTYVENNDVPADILAQIFRTIGRDFLIPIALAKLPKTPSVYLREIGEMARKWEHRQLLDNVLVNENTPVQFLDEMAKGR